MSHPVSIRSILGNTDIYLLDQIMKERYKTTDIILDAGCGSGRNLPWFLQNEITIYGIDQDPTAIHTLQQQYPSLKNRFHPSPVENLPFTNNYFNHVISSAVLHFATSTTQFHRMIAEMIRVLQPGGSLFIRMTSDIGIEDKVTPIAHGVYTIPDGSRRFLLTRDLLEQTMRQHKLALLEPLKTVNVNDVRCMSTLLLSEIS